MFSKTNLFTSATFLAATVAFSMVSGSANAAIKDTKHDLSLSNTTDQGVTSGDVGNTTEICVFCHTPHNATFQDGDSKFVPLWNRTISAYGGATTYTLYTTQTKTTKGGGTIGASIGGISLLCLSCHDGTQAMTALNNTPNDGTDAFFSGNTDKITDAEKLIVNGTDDTGLANDHPVEMVYSGSLLAPGTLGTDEYKLGTDVSAAGLQFATGDLVTCATCHDVHGTGNYAFLRINNTGSDLCLTCHVK